MIAPARRRRLLPVLHLLIAGAGLAACGGPGAVPVPELGPLADLAGVPVRLGLETRPAVRGVQDGRGSFETTLPDGRLVLALGWKRRAPSAGSLTARVSFVTRGGSRTLAEATLPPPGSGPEGWWETAVRVPEDLAGRSGSLVYETPGGAAGWTLRIAIPEPVAERAGRPNVVLISIDTLRGDRLGCYGNPRPTSPAIDAMAREGALFRNAFAPSNWTLPSHYSMMTSLYPSAHGVNPDRFTTGLVLHSRETVRLRGSGKEETLAERLDELGYWTAALTEGGWVQPRFGFDQGFASYAVYSDSLVGERRETVGRWLREHRELPFFLFLHTYEPHQPYHLPEPYDRMFLDPDHLGYALPGLRLPMSILSEFKYGDFPPMPADAEAFRGLYDGEVRYVDTFVEYLLATLRELGLGGDTLIAFTSDHGEELFEHGALDHGGTLYDEVQRVPFILWGPGRIPAGRVHDEPATLLDLLPTLVELAGGTVDGGLQGRSLVPVLEGREPPAGERAIFCESLFAQDSIPMECVWQGSWKLIVRGSDPRQVELYDLRHDPLERHDLAGRHPDDVARLLEVLAAWREESAAIQATLGGAEEGLDPELQERLKSLGYL